MELPKNSEFQQGFK